MKKKNKNHIKKNESANNPSGTKGRNVPLMVKVKDRRWAIIFFVLSLLLYANTLGHDYTQDDAIVIYDNMFTQKGVEGYSGILGKDTFYGFFKEEGKANLVTGGRYRPFTLLMFATEWEIFGRSPFVGHLINILLFAFLSVMIFYFLRLVFPYAKDNKTKLIVLFATIVFICHPIHTEAVANIKGRDEIMTMLGSVISLWAIIKYFDSKKFKFILLACISYFIALLSKENAITILGIAPLCFILFRDNTIITSLKRTTPLILVAIVFLLIRYSVLGMDFGSESNELMNNPFLKWENGNYVAFNFNEKFGTIFFTLGKYISLLLFPHPLSHDYYPRAIELMTFGDWQVIISLIIYLYLIFFSIKNFRSKKILVFGILFFLLTLSIVSNILFPIGTNMSERFLFMPSLGFSVVLASLLVKYITNKKVLLFLFILLPVLLSIKTITRNNIWKDDFTLFTTDVNNNTRSAKLLNAAGGTLSTRASTMSEGQTKSEYLESALGYLEKAISIHPLYRNAYLLLGNTNYYLKRYTDAIAYYDKALEISPGFNDVLVNLPIVLRDGAKYKGQIEKDFVTAEKWLLRSYNINTQDFETCRLLGVTYGVMGDHQKAVLYFTKAININPESAIINAALGTAYKNIGDIENARKYLNRAVEIDPNALNHLQNK